VNRLENRYLLSVDFDQISSLHQLPFEQCQGKLFRWRLTRKEPSCLKKI